MRGLHLNKDPSLVTPGDLMSGTPSRSYTHLECEGSTVVDGREFVVLADPFSFVSKTKCASCGEFVELDRVAWSDTRETISSFRERLRLNLSLIARVWAYVVGPLNGAITGAVIGMCWPPHKAPEIVTGVIGGAIIGWLVLQIPARQYLGMDFRTEK
jgi:hypothetical protein